MAAGRGYRSKLEVLRDFLRAAQEPAPKTRIIGAANLNPASFPKYLRLCTAHNLIMAVSGGYVATPRATPVLRAIEGIMLKSSELEVAVEAFERNALALGLGAPVASVSSQPRQALREAWNGLSQPTMSVSEPDREPPLVAGVPDRGPPTPPSASMTVRLVAPRAASPRRRNRSRAPRAAPRTRRPRNRTARGRRPR